MTQRRRERKTKYKYRVERGTQSISLFPFALPSLLPIFTLFALLSVFVATVADVTLLSTQQPTKELYNRNSKLTTWVCPHQLCTQFLRFHLCFFIFLVFFSSTISNVRFLSNFLFMSARSLALN